MSSYTDIQVCEHNLSSTKDAYLRAHGWKPTSNTPGCYWLWRRDFSDVNARRLSEHEAFCTRIKQTRVHHSYPGEMLVDTERAISMTWAEIDPQRHVIEEECD